MSETLHTNTLHNETEPNAKGGPRTQAGKAASSKNSFKHGLASGRILSKLNSRNLAKSSGASACLFLNYSRIFRCSFSMHRSMTTASPAANAF